MLVVDASVAVKWFVQERGTAEALGVLDDGTALIAPELLFLEVAHALWKKRRRGEVDVADVTESLDWLRRGMLELVPQAELLDEAAALMAALDHPIYDCLYLALAELADAPLVTDDERLCRRLAGTRFAARIRPLIASNAL